jgi:hypothetical protein
LVKLLEEMSDRVRSEDGERDGGGGDKNDAK